MSETGAAFVPRNPDYSAAVRAGFAEQPMMATIGTVITAVTPGGVSIELPYRADLMQQYGFLHGGVVGVIADSACGFAAYSLMPAGARVLTVEYKINFMAPAVGERFVATGQVIKAGRTLTVCQGEVVAYLEGQPKTVALMQSTLMTVQAGG